ncbi:MAG: hypothetical protein CVV44_17220 [Spirochaetae bacterium HGW-Spirochaetae-1]|jgi:hypothetical protein|nr:MAG: hypothetical protein CVV44_17220 [Spirochaetae bacterium HGW-Spirochaetae-1]
MKKRKKFITISFLIIQTAFLFIVHSAFALEKKKVAILNFVPNNVPASYANVVRDITEVRLYKTNAFDILERNRIETILREQGFEQTGCTDTGCAVELGKMLSVDMVVLGSVNKLAKFTITLKFIGVREGSVMYADSEIADVEGVIESSINLLANRSAEGILNLTQGPVKVPAKPSPPENKTMAGYYFRGIIPGLAQHYSDRYVKAAFFGIGFLAGGAYFGYSIYNWSDKRNIYENEDYAGLTEAEQQVLHDKNYDATQKAFRQANIALGIFAGIYLLNWIDVLFLSKPDFSSNTPGILHYNDGVNNIYFSFNLNDNSINEYYNEINCNVKIGISF